MTSLGARPVGLRSRSPRPPLSSLPSTSKIPSSKEPAHLPLHRRLLFPQYTPEKPLPRIIQGEGPEIAQLNERLYHVLALILRGYVLSWYPRFSKDRTLLPILARTVIVPVIQPILQRIHDDPSHLAVLLLVELPTMLELHLKTYWAARAALVLHPFPSRTMAGHEHAEAELGKAYHVRLPLPGVIPYTPNPIDEKEPAEEQVATPYRTPVEEGQYIASPDYLTSLTEVILARHLPPEELRVDVERTMAREIIARAILVNVCKRLAEPWTWYTLLLKFLPTPRNRARASGVDKSILHIAMLWCLGIYDIILWIWSKSITLMALYTASPPLDSRYRGSTDAWLSLAREVTGVDGREGLTRRTWTRRLQWGVVEVLGTLCGGILDRILPHLLHTAVLTPRTAIRLTEIVEAVLFPNGYPTPSPPDPSPAEIFKLRVGVESRIRGLLPPPLSAIICPDHAEISALLDPISSAGCNAHLIAMLLDGIVRALDPELAESSAPASDERKWAKDYLG